MTTPAIETFPDAPALQLAVVDRMVASLQQAVGERGGASVSLSGGSTPKRVYEMLASRDLPWDKIDWFWGDERNVPHDHEDSNYLMVRKALLDPAGIPADRIHAVDVQPDDPAAAAQAYENTLRDFFAGQSQPAFDLVLLGMGDDAHTASLFPATKALTENDRWFVENWVPKFDAFRYTMTAPAINSGRQIWFLVSGSNKQTAMGQVHGNHHNPAEYPSQLITPTHWCVTADAIAVGQA